MSDQYPSFDIYKREPDPIVPPPLRPGETTPGGDWDLPKSFGRGVADTATLVAGLPGAFTELAKAGLGKVGVPGSVLAPHPGIHTPPTPGDIQKNIEKSTGPFYEPQSTGGEYARTFGQFAATAPLGGGGVTSKLFNAAVPAAVSETAGQITKGQASEPYARAIAGIGAGMAVPRIVTPAPPPSPTYAGMVAALDREGVPLWAGQRTGSNAVQWLEAAAADMPLSSGAAQARTQAGLEGLGAATTRRAFDPEALQRPSSILGGLPADAQLPQTRAMVKGHETLSDEYNRLSQYGMNADRQLATDLGNVRTDYMTRSLPTQRAGGAQNIDGILQDIIDKFRTSGGTLPGDTYQTIRSDLGRHAKTALTTDPKLADALKGIQTALDQAMARGLPPGEAEAWALNNRRYANMKQLEPAVAAAGEVFTPAGLARTVRAGRGSQAARGLGDLDELTSAAATVMKKMPSSGTTQRMQWQNLFNVGNAISGGTGYMGSAFGPAGTAIGFAIPHAASRFAVSDLGQRYLANQAIPRSNRDLMTQAILQQAASQPSIRGE
jgi:hypothetical protein